MSGYMQYETEELADDIKRGKLKYKEKRMSQCHSVHHKSNMKWLGSNPDLCNGRPATNNLNQATCQKFHSLKIKLGVNKPQSLNCHTTSPVVLGN